MRTTLFVGGGTLGSVTPLLAVAEALEKMTPRVVYNGTGEGTISAEQSKREMTRGVIFWGTRRGPERAFVEAAGIPFRSIPAGKLRRYWDLRNLYDVFVIIWAFIIALVRLVQERPSVVVGAGSFVQVPVMWAAWALRIPIIIHQLDVRPSLANQLVAPFATRITVTFPESVRSFGTGPKNYDRRKLVKSAIEPSSREGSARRFVDVIGAPVRAAVLAARSMDPREAKRCFDFSGDRPVLLILGGGTGAQAINELVGESLPEITKVADVIHVTGTGKGKTSECFEFHPNVSNTSNIRGIRIQHSGHSNVPYRPFELLTHDLPSAYAAADLVVSRAGMGTIAELMALGTPCVLIPMPGTHQEENAAALKAAGAAVIWDQRGLTPEAFVERLRTELQKRSQGPSGEVPGTVFSPDAARRLARIIVHSISERSER